MALGVCTNSSKRGIFANFFVTTHNNPISYVKHVLDPVCVFSTLFGCWGGRGPKGAGAQLAYPVLQPSQLKNVHFRT